MMQALARCQKVKSRREREIWNPYLEFREEKCRDLFSGTRREQEFLKTNLMIREEIETSRFQTFRDEKDCFGLVDVE